MLMCSMFLEMLLGAFVLNVLRNAAGAYVLSEIEKTGLEFLNLCRSRCMRPSYGSMQVLEQFVWIFAALYNLLMNLALGLDVETNIEIYL